MRSNTKIAVLILIGVITCLAGCVQLSGQTQPPSESMLQTEPVSIEQVTELQATETIAITEPLPTDPVMLPGLAAWYEENPDLCGWLRIEDTALDYPLMYTPEEPEKYLRMDFDGAYSVGGIPFLDADCSLDPESDNLIIYGHNMRDGSQFRSVMMYKDKSYWEEHPTILLSTLYEEREYEVLAAFYDRVYYKYEDCFKFYQFIDAEDEAAFNEAISYYKENAEYDTGVTAEYGDRLITLVTCSYHCEHGRFVVVARENK